MAGITARPRAAAGAAPAPTAARPRFGAFQPTAAGVRPGARPAAAPAPAAMTKEEEEQAQKLWSDKPTDVQSLQNLFVKNISITSMSTAAMLKSSRVLVSKVRDQKTGARTNTVSDPRMGALEHGETCVTCKRSSTDCIGHFGHIELFEKVMNPIGMRIAISVFQAMQNLGEVTKDKWIPNYSDADVATVLSYSGQNRLRILAELRTPDPRVGVYEIQESLDTNEVCFKTKENTKAPYTRHVRNVEDVFKILDSVSNKDAQLLGFSNGSHPRNLVMSLLPVIPPCDRPPSEQDGRIWEDELTKSYENIIKTNIQLAAAARTGNTTEQSHMRTFLNKHIIEMFLKGEKSILSRIQGKDAWPRAHMMGKRVDYSGRTVISPDPSLRFGQVRVPKYIADTITKPVRITTLSLKSMQTALRAGQVKRITDKETGRRVVVDKEMEENYIPKIGDVFHRVLRNGDYVIVNRQPTLSGHSFMAMEAVIGLQNTFGLHVSYTTPYNADFDGDEMNIHVPQDPETEAELMALLNVKECLMTGATNKNAMGIVYNGITAALLLTQDTTDVSPVVYYQALMLMTERSQLGTLDERLARHHVRPYSGKALFSACLPADFFYTRKDVVIRQGVLVKGEITKADIGPASGSIIQNIWHMSSPERASAFITDAVFVLDYWLSQRGFSVGFKDCYPDDKRVKKEVEAYIVKTKALVESLGPRLENPVEESVREQQIIEAVSGAPNVGKKILEDIFGIDNPLIAMVRSGAKGSAFNIAQIHAIIGQQKLVGKRLTALSRYYDPDDPDTALEARGFIENSFMLGQTPGQMFMHQASGREGIIDTAVNTADSGNAQHRVIKVAENVMTNYDGTVGNQSAVFQYIYGEEGLSPDRLFKIHIPTSLDKSANALSFINMTAEVDRLNAKYGY